MPHARDLHACAMHVDVFKSFSGRMRVLWHLEFPCFRSIHRVALLTTLSWRGVVDVLRRIRPSRADFRNAESGAWPVTWVRFQGFPGFEGFRDFKISLYKPGPQRRDVR